MPIKDYIPQKKKRTRLNEMQYITTATANSLLLPSRRKTIEVVNYISFLIYHLKTL